MALTGIGFLFIVAITLTDAEVLMNRDGCGTTKACLFKPAGCDPNLDCTIGLIFFVVGENQLRVEMVATSLIPSVQQQYIAIGFSNDPMMGEDFVTECVMSDMGQFAGWEPEIFVSFNHGNSNDRIFLNDDEHRTMITNISSQVVDGRLVCHFTQQLIPQIDRKNGLVWSLDKEYYILGATGSAQPDEVNAHDMNRGSHFFPIVSSAKINPSQLSLVKYDTPLSTNVISKEKVSINQETPESMKPDVDVVSPTTAAMTTTVSQTENSSTLKIFPFPAVLLLLLRLL
ncbi:unnamed protein product [Cylicocyclus nassatus]|uniref:DOMON domain-containing protein n=1 Tax=Cylicocyclus nassatus TaxID=53992 RepID=A0AA36MBS9_CYLNA|nr:unnamed protein product [Cylicocyclus nassatus]